jgi:hypothetical protein
MLGVNNLQAACGACAHFMGTMDTWNKLRNLDLCTEKERINDTEISKLL